MMPRPLLALALLALPLFAATPVAAEEEGELNPLWEQRCEQGDKFKGNLPPQFTQGRCCYMVAKGLASSDFNKALAFANKACDLKDSLGCVEYAVLAADPLAGSAELLKARDRMGKLCQTERILDARKLSDDTGIVCFQAARALFTPDQGQTWPMEEREKLEARKLLDSACKAHSRDACEVLKKHFDAAGPAPKAKDPELADEWPEEFTDTFMEQLNVGKLYVPGPRSTKGGPACQQCGQKCSVKHVACQASTPKSGDCEVAAHCFCACLRAAGSCGYPKEKLDLCVTETAAE